MHQSVLECLISTCGNDHVCYLLPCQRQDPFGILYFSPFPRHREAKPSRREAGGGRQEETSCKRKLRAPSASSVATACLHPSPAAFSPEGGGQDEEGASQPASASLRCSDVQLRVNADGFFFFLSCQGLVRSVRLYISGV